MKNRILIVLLFLSLFGHNAFSQRRLSPALRPFAENWTYTLVKSMHRAGFDMPTMPATAPLTKQGSNPLRLDSTKTFFEYSQGWGGDSTPLFRSTYTYPLPNTKIETNFQFDNGQWMPLNRSTLISDGQQRLVEIIAEVFDEAQQAFIPETRLEIFPHGNSLELMDSLFTYLWDPAISGWRAMLSNHNQFDAQDRLLESVSWLDHSGDPLVFKEVYAYDVNGDNHLIEEFTKVGNDLVPVSRTEITYVDHRPIEVLVSSSDGVVYTPKSRTNYAHTLFGAIRKQMDFEWDTVGQRWYLFKTTDYAYDNEERISTKMISINTVEERELTSYGYIKEENLYVEMEFNWDDDLFDWILDSKKYYYYGGSVSVKPNPVSAKALQVSPNPAVDFARMQLDQPAFFQIYDSQGELVSSGTCQADHLLNLSELPSGLYYVSARTETEVYAGKIVKQ